MTDAVPVRHIVHRRRAVRRGKPEPRGLESILACLSPIGWLSILGAVAMFWIGIKPMFEVGALAQQSTATLLLQVVNAATGAALLAVPAALEVGSPGIARRNPWLWRGAVLLAATQMAGPILDVVQELVTSALDPEAAGMLDPETPLGMAFRMAGLAIGIIRISGAWGFADGLADAGARLPRFVVPVVAGLVIVATFGVYASALVETLDLTTVSGWLNGAGFVMSLALFGLYVAIALRLMAGIWRRLVPVRAWIPAGLAGLCLFLVGVTRPALLAVQVSAEIGVAYRAVSMAIWPLVLLAALLGMGRGTRVRRVRPPLRRLYIVNPTD